MMGKRSQVDLGAVMGTVQRMDVVVTRTQVLKRPLRELNLTRRTGVTIGRITRCGVDLVPRGAAAGVCGSCDGHWAGDGAEDGGGGIRQCAGIAESAATGADFHGDISGGFNWEHSTFDSGVGRAAADWIGGWAADCGDCAVAAWEYRVDRVVHAGVGESAFSGFWAGGFPGLRGVAGGGSFLAACGAGAGAFAPGAGGGDHDCAGAGCGAVSRLVLKMNFITLAGWIAGAMTSSPALIFADELAQTDAPAVAYAAVAPLATLIPILCAQILAITSGS